MSKVVVVGGGASGMIAAIVAAENHEVILLEKNEKCGKKILLTGNGKCNYWNEDIQGKQYFTHEKEILDKILSKENQEEVFHFLEYLGIYPRKKNGYYYPYSNQASSIREILWRELEKRKVEVLFHCDVDQIIKKSNQFQIDTNLKTFFADRVILATGSNACPKTGSDGKGYKILSFLSHTIYPVLPALVQLKTDFTNKDLDGVKVDAIVSLFVDSQLEMQEEGELLFTNYGVSGICVLNVSGRASVALEEQKQVTLSVNFVPFVDNDFFTWFTERNQKILHHTIEELLESIFPYQLLLLLLKKSGIERNQTWNEISEKKKKEFAKLVEHFTFQVVGTNSYDRAQVCTGGVSLLEINPHTMESKNVAGLFIVGELLDVCGKCGGFNLAFAWISGYLAGRGVMHD